LNVFCRVWLLSVQTMSLEPSSKCRRSSLIVPLPGVVAEASKVTRSGAAPALGVAVKDAVGGVPPTLMVRLTGAEVPHALVAVSVAVFWPLGRLKVCCCGVALLLQVTSGVPSLNCRRRLVMGELPSADAEALSVTFSGAGPEVGLAARFAVGGVQPVPE
jgi:hypothetical protein